MKAAVLPDFGVPLRVEDVPDLTIGTGEVLVDVAAAPVLSYADEVFSGARRYLLPTPVVTAENVDDPELWGNKEFAREAFGAK